MSSKVRVRFAPSPTGTLHVGGIRSALFDWLYARHTGGSFILRIEDTDQARSTKESMDQILEALRWLGLDWDEGPDKGGEYGPYIQSERLSVYHEYRDKLMETGQAYFCYCSPERLDQVRKAAQEKKQDPKYDRHCLSLSDEEKRKLEAEGVKPVVRFKVPDEGKTAWEDTVRGRVEFEHKQLDDYVLIKSDGFPTYHFASVVDDHLMEISHVLRGDEWVSSTPKHLLLYQAFGFEPPVFVHVPLILGPDKAKLAKRHGATSVLEYRQQGYLSDALVNFLSLLGWSPDDDTEVMGRNELVRRFALEGITKSPAVFDTKKLEWMNKKYLSDLSDDALADLAMPYLTEAGLVADPDAERDRVRTVCGLLKERLTVLADVVPMSRYFFTDEFGYEEKGITKYFSKPELVDNVAVLRERLTDIEQFSSLEIENVTRKLAEERGLGASKIIHPTRLAVSGCLGGPGLFELMETVGKDATLRRMDRAVREYGNATGV